MRPLWHDQRAAMRQVHVEDVAVRRRRLEVDRLAAEAEQAMGRRA